MLFLMIVSHLHSVYNVYCFGVPRVLLSGYRGSRKMSAPVFFHFQFDFSPFNGSVTLPPAAAGGGSKYPAIKPNYEATNVSDLYVGKANASDLTCI